MFVFLWDINSTSQELRILGFLLFVGMKTTQTYSNKHIHMEKWLVQNWIHLLKQLFIKKRKADKKMQ